MRSLAEQPEARQAGLGQGSPQPWELSLNDFYMEPGPQIFEL